MSDPTDRTVWVTRDPLPHDPDENWDWDIYAWKSEPKFNDGDGWEAGINGQDYEASYLAGHLKNDAACLAEYGVIPEPGECVEVLLKATKTVISRTTAEETDQ